MVALRREDIQHRLVANTLPGQTQSAILMTVIAQDVGCWLGWSHLRVIEGLQRRLCREAFIPT